jgi:hypothetical protein
MARVQVDDETWGEFRAQLGATPVSVALGGLVKREVARRRRLAASDPAGVRMALEDARELAGELASMIARLEAVQDARIRERELESPLRTPQ